MSVCEDACEDWHLAGEGGPLSLVLSVSGLSHEVWPHPHPAFPEALSLSLLAVVSCFMTPLSISLQRAMLSLTASISLSVSVTPLDCSLVCVCRHLSVSLWLWVPVWLCLLLDLGSTHLWGEGAAQTQVFPRQHLSLVRYRGCVTPLTFS